MNLDRIRHNDGLREKLAAEYAIGTLRGGARRRFEQWLRQDAALRRAVAEWQDRLCPMAELAPSAQPSPQVWRAIERQLDLAGANADAVRRPFWRRWQEDLRFWRGLGTASTAVAAILVAVLLIRQPAAPAPSYVAMLTDDKAQPTMVVTGDMQQRRVTVKMVARPDIPSDKSLELWAVPKDGAPHSLGLVAADGNVTLPLPDDVSPQSMPILAISLEPKGGSPNRNAPTGPILFKGAWIRI